MPDSGKARLVIIQQIYHQIFNQQPRPALDARHSRILKSDEQSYGPRTITIGEEWVPLELGWLKDTPIGMIVLTNEEGRFMDRNPTLEQAREGEKKILELSFTCLGTSGNKPSYAATLLIPPRESQTILPANPKEVMIRCRSGQGKYTILIVPA